MSEAAAAGNENVEVYSVNRLLSYSLFRDEVRNYDELCAEFVDIQRFYDIYFKGAKFNAEGTNNDYVPADLKYKIGANLINKEARFLFGSAPDVDVNIKGKRRELSKQEKDQVSQLQSFINEILDKNNFEDKILKAAKDCFVGKRIACLVNFNEEDGIMISFHRSTNFVYETSSTNPDSLIKFVCLTDLVQTFSNVERRIFKKRYELKNGAVYLEEAIYDGLGNMIEMISEESKTLLTSIPAFVIINDGLTGDQLGESEISNIKDTESWYSKLANADKDNERKSMNPTRYAVDMDPNSTEGLSSAAGSFWDLSSDANHEGASPSVGVLEPSMSYSEALKTTLARIKTSAYEMVDMPDISLESMTGVITSGKSLEAIYWGLEVRCMEKMKAWGPKLQDLISMIIDGAKLYPLSLTKYDNKEIPDIDYMIDIKRNVPLPGDEAEEKQMDLSEVESQAMSRLSYMKKWRRLTDNEANEELIQIAKERQILEDISFEPASMPSNTKKKEDAEDINDDEDDEDPNEDPDDILDGEE